MKQQSAIEREFQAWLWRQRANLIERDRFVVLAFFLSFTPLPIAPFLAIILSTIQLRLITLNKLDSSEKGLLTKSVIIAFINITIWLSVSMWLFNTGVIDNFFDFISNILFFPWRLFGFFIHMPPSQNGFKPI